MWAVGQGAADESAGSAWATAMSAGTVDPAFAEVVSRARKKKEKKNLLVVKATDASGKATDKKEEVSKALTGIQIKDSRFTPSGTIVMNFENETTMNEAAKKLESVPDMTTMNVKKLKPKIMICNVREEEIEDDILKTMIDRNDYLKNVDNIHEKIHFIMKKQAAGGTFHYIYKCEPDVRGMINKNKDKVKLQWGIYNIRDRYHPLVCYHCQRYGHIADNCKDKEEDPCCFKCAGNHKSKTCTTDQRKCINCERRKKSDTKHSATDYSCPVRSEEVDKIINLTDHGF